MSEVSNYIGFHLRVPQDAGDDWIREKAQQLLDPVTFMRRQAETHRAAGVDVREVVIERGGDPTNWQRGEQEELTFDEFIERYS